jgi:hypothetical protein
MSPHVHHNCVRRLSLSLSIPSSKGALRIARLVAVVHVHNAEMHPSTGPDLVRRGVWASPGQCSAAWMGGGARIQCNAILTSTDVPLKWVSGGGNPRPEHDDVPRGVLHDGEIPERVRSVHPSIGTSPLSRDSPTTKCCCVDLPCTRAAGATFLTGSRKCRCNAES